MERESALCEVIESRERSYASQRVISPSSGARERFVPSSRAFPLFQRGDWMIKLPIDSHLFSSSRTPRLSRRRCGTQVLRPTTKREQPAQSCLRIDLYTSSLPRPSFIRNLHLSRERRLYSSLLSVLDVSEIRLSNMHDGFVWWGRTAHCFIRIVMNGFVQ